MFERLKKIVSSVFFGNTRKRKEIKGAKDDNPLAQKIKRLGYAIFDSGRSDEFSSPPFDLEEVINAYNTDSYIRQALDKYIELMFKSGWSITYKRIL